MAESPQIYVPQANIKQGYTWEITVSINDADVENLNFRGLWSNVTEYKIYDGVEYNDTKYRCILDSTANIPTDVTYWEEIVETPVDVSTSTFTFELSNSEGVAYAIDTDLAITRPADHQLLINIPPADTDQLDEGVYQLALKQDDGTDIFLIFVGTIVVEPSTI